MPSSSAPRIDCRAGEGPSSLVICMGAASLLLIVSLIECGIAALMISVSGSAANFAFLLCTLALLAATVLCVRDAAGRNSVLVQSAAAAALLILFWASGSQAHSGPSITIGHATYELTLTLAGLLFIAMLLARLLRRNPAEQACNCG